MSVGTSSRPAIDGSGLYPDTAPAWPVALDPDLHADPVGHFLHVRDHADLAALGLQAIERVHGHAQGAGVKAAETFVDEQGFDADPLG